MDLPKETDMNREVADRLGVLKVHLEARGLATKEHFGHVAATDPANELTAKVATPHLTVTNPANKLTATVVVTPYEADDGERWFFARIGDPVGTPVSHFMEATAGAAVINRLLLASPGPTDVSAILSGTKLAAQLIHSLTITTELAAEIAAKNGHLKAEVIHAALASHSPEGLRRLRITAALIAALASSKLAEHR